MLSHAQDSLSQLRRDLDQRCELAALVLREPRLLPSTLAEILGSRQVIYIADSEMYLDALSRAARMLSISVVSHPRSGEFEFGSRALASSPDELSKFVLGIRKTLGPPWQKDHHAATAAALGALAELQQLGLSSS